jgi:hypothetical protein
MGTDVTGNPNPFLDTANWQGVDDEPTAESDNLVKSGGVAKYTKNIIPNITLGEGNFIEIQDDHGVTVGKINENGADFLNLKSNGKDVFVSNSTKNAELSDFIEFRNEGDSPVMRISSDGVYVDSLRSFYGNALIRKTVIINKTDTDIEILTKFINCFNEGNCDIYFESSTYVFSECYTYMVEQLGWHWTLEFPIGNNCRYFFNGSKIISNPPSTPLPANESRNIFGVKASAQTFELYDGVFINNGGTYCVHDEANTDTGYYKHIYKNIYMEYNETEDSTYISKCIGGGAGCNGLILIEECAFVTNEDNTIPDKGYVSLDNNVTWHGSNNNTEDEYMKWFVNGCYFSKGFRVSKPVVEKNSYYYCQFANNSVLSSSNIIIESDIRFLFNNEIRNNV